MRNENTVIIKIVWCLVFVLSLIFFMMSEDTREVEFIYEDGTVGEPIIVGGVENTESDPQPIQVTPEECILDEDQLDIIKYSYDVGFPHDLGYTLAAISLVESNAGRWKINIQDPGGGLYHVGLDKVLADKGWERSSYNLNRSMQLLVDDNEYAARLAIQELSNWKEHNSSNWLDVWASYHKGWSGPKIESGKKYAETIRKTIQKIRSCGWVEPIISEV